MELKQPEEISIWSEKQGKLILKQWDKTAASKFIKP